MPSSDHCRTETVFNSVCWSHALVNGPTSKRPASDGGLCSGQLLMMWSAVCSGSPHSHAALSASPHFFMDGLYRPTPVRSLFRVVQCFRRRSSPLTPSPGSDMWRCTRVGPDASHSCIHVAAIHASFDRSSGMTLSNDHCRTETVPLSGDNNGTTKVAPPSDHLPTKNNVN